MRFIKKQQRQKNLQHRKPFMRQLQENVRRALLSGIGIMAAGGVFIGTSTPAYALPTGGEITAGSAEISTSQQAMEIHQTTQNAVIDWQSFNIAADERVNILQPSEQAALLNRVLGNTPSEIFGSLQANGRVFLVNPAGVLFAKTAQVNTGSLFASAMNITNADFMAEKYDFSAAPTVGKVINRATLQAKEGGTVALLGKDVVNEGVIVAKKGTAILAAGDAVSLDFIGDGKVKVVPTKAALVQAVKNKGIVDAPGGLVFMSAATGDALIGSVVNQEGIVRAKSLDGKAGTIRMTANDVYLKATSTTDVSGEKAGKIEIGGGWQGTGDLAHAKNLTIERGAVLRADAKTQGAGGTVTLFSDGLTRFFGEISARAMGTGAGGSVETSGKTVHIKGKVDASSPLGKAGKWLIDPDDVVIRNLTSGEQESGSLADAKRISDSLSSGTSVEVKTASTNNEYSLTVQDAITKTGGGDATLSLKATGNIALNANITSTAGKLHLDIVSDTNNRAGGNVSIKSGKEIKTLGGNLNIRGGLKENNIGFANSQSTAGVELGAALIDTQGGNVELAGSTTSANAGISLVGTKIKAGTGKVTLIGKSHTGKGIAIDAASKIWARNIEMRTDSLELSGTIVGDGDQKSTAKVWTLSSDKKIHFGTPGDLFLAGNTFSSTGKIQNFNKNIVGDENQNTNIEANAITADHDLTLQTGAGKLTLSGALTVAPTHTLTLSSKNSIEGAGVLTADALLLNAADATVNLTGIHNLKKLDGAAKGLKLKNNQSLTVGEDKGLMSKEGGVDLDVVGDLSVGAQGIKNTSGALKLKAGAAIKLEENAKIESTGKALTSLEAAAVNFAKNSKVKTTGALINVKTDALTLPNEAKDTLSSANGNISIETKTAGKTMSVGAASAADLALLNLDFINSGTGEIHLGNEHTGNIEIAGADVKAPLLVDSGATIKFSGAITNKSGKNMTFRANSIDFAAGANIAADKATLTMLANTVTNWQNAFFADTNGKGTFVLKPRTAGDFLVGGTTGLVTDDGFAKLKAGNFYNVAIGDKENNGQATVLGISAGNLPKYTSILTKGKISITGAVVGTPTDTLALYADAPGASLGDALEQSAPLTVGNLLLTGKGSLDLSTQANKITNIAADMKDGDLKLKNQTHMKVAVVEDRTVKPSKNIEGLKTKSMDLRLAAGKKLTIESNLISTNDTKITADDLDLGTKVNVGKKLTLEKANTANAINVGTKAGDWNVNNANYGEIKLGGASQTGDINIQDATFKKPSDIETQGKVTLKGATKAGADGKGDMKIKANAAELPTASDTLAAKNLELNLTGELNLGNGKIKGQKDGKVKVSGVPSGKDIYFSNNKMPGHSPDYYISYKTINETFENFGGFDIAGSEKLYFYEGKVNKSIKAAGKRGVEVRGDLSVEGDGTKLTIGEKPPSAGAFPDSVITGKFTIRNGKTVSVKGKGAAIEINTGDNIHLEDRASLNVAGENANFKLKARNGDVILDNMAKVNVVAGGNIQGDLTGQKLFLRQGALINTGDAPNSILRIHTDEIGAANNDGVTNIIGKGGLAISPKSRDRQVTINNTATGTGLHITGNQLNGELFGKEFSSLTVGDEETGDVLLDGLTADNHVAIHTAANRKLTIGAGGLTVGDNRRVTLKTGSVENNNGAGSITVGTGSTLNLNTNSIEHLKANAAIPSVNGTGTLGIATYDGTKTIGLGDAAAGDLRLTNEKFTNVFGSNFSHYSIGNGAQGTINVNGSTLSKDVTLQANTINFAGDLNIAEKTLTIHAKTAANQTAGSITAAKLAAIGGNIALEKENKIKTLAADALSVKVKSDTLTIGKVKTPEGAEAPSRTLLGVKAGKIGTAAGDIVLSADAMNFEEAVSGEGNLTIEQKTASTNLNIGTVGTGLTLPASIFGGAKIKDGFKHVYLGREDATGATKVGSSLNFVDPTTIRSGKTAGSLTLDATAKIKTGGNDFTLESKNLTQEAGSEVDTAEGALTLKTDKIDLNGKLKGKKALNVLPLSSNQDISLGADDPSKLSLLNRYFEGNNRVFWDYEIINIGDRNGSGRLYQSGSIDMPFKVNIQQAIATSSGGVNITGTIKTNGKDYTIASREVNLNNATISADDPKGIHHGNVAINTDKLTNTNSKIQGHGEVSFDTYTRGKTLNFGTPSTGGAASDSTLSSDIFSGTGLLQKNSDGKGFKRIRIGGENAGNINVGNVDIKEGLADTLSLKTNGAVNSTGVLKSAKTLEIEANSVNLTGDNEIKNLGNITSANGVNIETKGTTTVTGKIEGKDATVQIKNKGGNVTIAAGGSIVGTGTADVVVEAQGGAFKNKAGKNALKTAPGRRYIVHTQDSVENEIDGLHFDFRRYGTDYNERDSITVPAGKNAMFYKYQPVLKLYSTRAYGDDNGAFFNDGSGYRIVDDGNEKRRELDKDAIKKIHDTRANSSSHHFTTSKKTNANADITSAAGTISKADEDTKIRPGARTYGTDATNANEKIEYTGPNELNYKITVDYRIVPRVVKVTGKNDTVTYNGNPHTYTGTNGVTFQNFANEETFATPGLLSGAVSYTKIADKTKTSGYAQGAVHAGEYVVDLANSNLKASNYTFKYVQGKLTIKPRDIHFNAPNGERIYGTANDTVNMTSNTTYTGTLLAGDSFSKYTVRAIDNSGNAVTERTGVGSYTMTLDGATLAKDSKSYDSDYNITATTGTLSIKKRDLYIKAGDKSRTYGDANESAGYIHGTKKVNIDQTTATTGLVNGDTVDDVEETIDQRATSSTDAGTTGLWTKADAAHFSSGTANNYNIHYTKGSLSIEKRALKLAAGDKSRIYGTANETAVYTNGTRLFRIKEGNLVNSDSIISAQETIDPRANIRTDAGTKGLTTKITNAVFGTGKASNYDISYEEGSFTITARDLKLHAGDKSRIYGTANETAEYINGTKKFSIEQTTPTSGLVNGDSIADVEETTNATGKTNVGASGLKTSIKNARFSKGKASNYNISYEDGSFSIKKRDLYIKAGDKSRTYGAANETAAYINGTKKFNIEQTTTTTGLVNGDSIADVEETTNATDKTNVGTLGLKTSIKDARFSTGQESNYTIHYLDGEFTVTAREVLIKAGDVIRNYGEPNPPVKDYSVERGDQTSKRGLLAGDDLKGITGYYDGAITPQTEPGYYKGVVHIDPLSVAKGYQGGSAFSNYRFSYAPGTLTIYMRGIDISTPTGNAMTSVKTTAAELMTRLNGTSTESIGSFNKKASLAAIPDSTTKSHINSKNGVGADSIGKTAGNFSKIVSQDNTLAADILDTPQNTSPSGWQSRVVTTFGGSAKAHEYVQADDGSFGFDLAKTRGSYENYDALPSGTAAGVPVLFTDGKSRDLDGIYSINYNPGKLAIKPASQKVDIPDPEEIENLAEQSLRFLYQTQSGTYEITFGNGIVSLYPKDEPALAIITGKNKNAERAVLASGILTAIEDLKVTPMEIRAVYIFKKIQDNFQ